MKPATPRPPGGKTDNPTGAHAMRSLASPSLFLAGLLAPALALAHPHHGGGSALGAGLLHLLSEPDHLAVLLVPVAIAAAWVWHRRVRAKREAIRHRVD